MRLIDIHTHGIGGYDTRSTVEDHILTIAELQGRYGVHAIVPTIYCGTIRVMRDNMMVIKGAMEKQALQERSSDVPPPATIMGVHLEGPFLNPEKCGSLNAMTFLEPNKNRFNELIEGFEDIIKIITIAPELDGAVELIRAIADKGIIPSMGHSDATYAQAEEGYQAGAKGITHLFNAMRGIHHREPGLAGFGLMHQDIYIEVIADAYHIHPTILEMIFRVKDHNRILIISDSVKETRTSSEVKGITDRHGTLLGGAFPLTESISVLADILGTPAPDLQARIARNATDYLGI